MKTVAHYFDIYLGQKVPNFAIDFGKPGYSCISNSHFVHWTSVFEKLWQIILTLSPEKAIIQPKSAKFCYRFWKTRQMLSSTYSYISTQLRVTHKFVKWLTHLAHLTFTFVHVKSKVLYSIKTETRAKHCGIQISLW